MRGIRAFAGMVNDTNAEWPGARGQEWRTNINGMEAMLEAGWTLRRGSLGAARRQPVDDDGSRSAGSGDEDQIVGAAGHGDSILGGDEARGLT